MKSEKPIGSKPASPATSPLIFTLSSKNGTDLDLASSLVAMLLLETGAKADTTFEV